MRPALRKHDGDDAQETNKTRVQLDLAPSQMERLNWLMEICDIDTRKDLVNVALSVFEWAVNQVIDGRTIAAVDKEAKHFVELGLPALTDAARNAATRVRARPVTEEKV
jgi:hypothetical protein